MNAPDANRQGAKIAKYYENLVPKLRFGNARQVGRNFAKRRKLCPASVLDKHEQLPQRVQSAASFDFPYLARLERSQLHSPVPETV